MRRLIWILCCYLTCTHTVTCSCTANFPGHLKSIGNHQPPKDNVTSMDSTTLSPNKFYKTFVVKNQPVLIKQALKASKPLLRWQDVYLQKTFGDEYLNVDQQIYENRSMHSEEMKLARFLSIYKQSLKLYLISTLPYGMQQEFPLPTCLLCKEFINRLQDFVLWFSSGNTNSYLHFDNVENLYCQLDGTKHWFIVDPINGSAHITLDHYEGQYCGVNVSAVDMCKYPGMQNVPWWKAVTRPGDCLYVPLNWWHQVRSESGRNMAVNIWWAPFLEEFKSTHLSCDEIFENLTLSELKFTHGEWIKWRLATFLKENDGKASFDLMESSIIHEHTGEKLITRSSFDALDLNHDNILEYSELLQHPLEVIHASVQYVDIGVLAVTSRDRLIKEKKSKDEL